MALYIAADGSWGDATDLLIVDDSGWCPQDYEDMGTWTERGLMAYAEAVSNNPKLTPKIMTDGGEVVVTYLSPEITPTQWETKQNES
jgi:hypothetical protein